MLPGTELIACRRMRPWLSAFAGIPPTPRRAAAVPTCLRTSARPLGHSGRLASGDGQLCVRAGRSTRTLDIMCLDVLVRVEPSAGATIGPPTLRAVSGLAVRKVTFEGRTAFHVSTDGTCSCGLLAAGCDPEGEFVALNEDALESLARIIEALSSKGKSFDFLATWTGGERPRRTNRTSAERLAHALRSNEVRNNVLFEVRT
jgi:hypothetical protein